MKIRRFPNLIQKSFLNRRYVLLVLFSLYFIFIVRIYYERIGSFSFGDEYNNFIAGYFMLKGRILFSQIFFNHQILMADLSFFLQKLFHPATLYRLVFLHRFFVIVFSGLFDLFLILRFRLKASGFVFFYEILKYYLFGNLFLAEALIVYPFVYLFFLSEEKLKGELIANIEIVLSGIFAWFIIFMREPFIPLALFLYCFILWKNKKKVMILSMGVFILLSFLTLLSVDLKDFFNQVILFNLHTTIPSQVSSGNIFGSGLFTIIFYPTLIFFGGKWNFFRYNLIGLDLLFISLLLYNLFFLKKYRVTVLVFLSLAISGFRMVSPGMIFFESFHMLIWFALFISSIFVFLENVFLSGKINVFILFLLYAVSMFGFIFSPQSFVWEKVNRDESFTINYARHFLNGEAIRILSDKNDTMFADTWDYLLYWQAGIDSAYRFAVYTFVMMGNKNYQNARKDMFASQPPTFYYTYSPAKDCTNVLPASRIDSYVRLYSKDKNTCLFILKQKKSSITKNSWKKVNELGFYL